MTNIQDIKLIEQYRSGSLSTAELETFEHRLVEDASFKELYNDFYEAEDLLKFKELWDVKGELDKLDYADESDEGSWSKFLYGLVALAVLSGGVLTYVLQNSKEENIVLTQSRITNKSVADPIIQKHPEKLLVKSNVGIENRGSDKKEPYESLMASVPEELKIIDKVTVIQEQVASQVEIKPLDLVKNCLGTPKVDYTIESACNGEANGRLIFKKVSGEYYPYYIFNANEKLENRGSFDDLKKGLYEILVVDNRACETKINVEVKSMDCDLIHKEEANKLNDYKIYLPHETWKILASDSYGYLEIQDQSGGLVFNKKLGGDTNIEWDGVSNQGKEVAPGVYYFNLKDVDNRIEKTGTITIMK